MIEFTVTNENLHQIPQNVTHLTFEDDFNQPLVSGVIPNSVTHLTFGWSFNQPLTQGVTCVIPNSVTHLTFGENFNQPLVVPNSVTHLTFGRSFNQPLSTGAIPNSVTHLTFEPFNEYNCFDTFVIPNSVTHLDLGFNLYQFEYFRFIPSSVTHLTFGIPFIHKDFVLKALDKTIQLNNVTHIYIRYHDYGFVTHYTSEMIDWLNILFNNHIPKNIKYVNDVNYRYCYQQFSTAKFNEELTQKVFNPLRLQKMAKEYHIEFMDLVDMY